jgi:hypothetical protein
MYSTFKLRLDVEFLQQAKLVANSWVSNKIYMQPYQMTNLAMFLIGFFGLSALLTVLYVSFRPVCVRVAYEGFRDSASAATATPEEAVDANPHVRALRKILGKVNRIGRSLADPELWAYRISLLGKSPKDLARMHLNSQTPSE